MKKLTAVMMVVTAIFIGHVGTLQAMPATNIITIEIHPFYGLAPTDPSNSLSQLNIMSYVDKGYKTGLIPTDFANDPTALNFARILAVSRFVYSPASYLQHDTTNNPTGAWANANGGRLIWTWKIHSSTPFLLSEANFSCDSSEPQNSLHYAGNLGTNTADGLSLTFSSTLVGWVDGMTNSYHNGESTTTNMVNTAIGLIKEGYYSTDPATTALILAYFKAHIEPKPMVATLQISLRGSTNSASISSAPMLWSNNGVYGYPTFNLDGQGQLSMTYTILGHPSNMNTPFIWDNLWTSAVNGFSFGKYYDPDNGFFKVYENPVQAQPNIMTASSSSFKVVQNEFKPIINGSNAE